MSRPRLPLLLGLALGSAVGAAAGALIFLRAASSRDPLASARPLLAIAPVPAWSWRDAATPPRLADPASISAALAAWRNLRAPDGGPADFATRVAALRALLLRLPAADYPRLLDALAAETSPDADALRRLAFTSWVELDPAAAARWASAAPDRVELLRTALKAWSAADARAAAAWACALPDEKLSAEFAHFLLPALAEIDAPAALALASARGEDALTELLSIILPVLARRDPVATVQTYGPLLWDDGNGLFQLRKALGAWADRDPAAAIAWILAQPAGPHGPPTRNLSCLQIKPANRPAFAQTLLDAPGLLRRHEALGYVLSDWAGDDSAGAVAWARKIPDADLRAALLDRTLTGSYDGAPDRLLPFALALPEGKNREQRLAHFLDKWAQNSPTDALRWIEAHADDPGVVAASFAAHAAVLGVIARDDPAAAIAEWKKLPEGEAKHQGLRTIADSWGRADPAAALQWQVAQTHHDRAADPSRQLIFQWARKEPAAALRWAETLPVEIRPHALRSLTDDGGSPTPPAATLDLYAQIRDPALRAEFVTAHARDWLAKDRPAATAWLENHDALTPEQAAALLAPATK